MVAAPFGGLVPGVLSARNIVSISRTIKVSTIFAAIVLYILVIAYCRIQLKRFLNGKA